MDQDLLKSLEDYKKLLQEIVKAWDGGASVADMEDLIILARKLTGVK